MQNTLFVITAFATLHKASEENNSRFRTITTRKQPKHPPKSPYSNHIAKFPFGENGDLNAAFAAFHYQFAAFTPQNRHTTFINSSIHTSKSALSIHKQPKTGLQTAASHCRMYCLHSL